MEQIRYKCSWAPIVEDFVRSIIDALTFTVPEVRFVRDESDKGSLENLKIDDRSIKLAEEVNEKKNKKTMGSQH